MLNEGTSARAEEGLGRALWWLLLDLEEEACRFIYDAAYGTGEPDWPMVGREAG